MQVTTEHDPEKCICDSCHNDGCKSHLREMRIVVGCNDFVNAEGDKTIDIIYSTTVSGIETDNGKGEICKICHNESCQDVFRDTGSVIGCPMFMDATGRQFHMTRESL